MSYVERAKQILFDPLEYEEVHALQIYTNQLVGGFLDGTITVNQLRKGLSVRESDKLIKLPYPGPLYGLLRKLGFDQDLCRHIAYEERDHYSAAIAFGLETKIIIQVSKPREVDNTYPRQLFLNVYLSFKIPDNIDPNILKEIIRQVVLAPKHPSQDDLAKIPPSSV
ncbi:hypothetical protein HY045_01630 [Candidatus Woesebacteria bacterium]|nr:hypothetical protein [Candidatus Woesebacteria bacterium]